MQAQPLCSNSNCRTHRRRRWPSKLVLCDRCVAGRNRADGIAANALRSALLIGLICPKVECRCLSIIIICPGLDSRPGPPSSTCWRAWSAREGKC